MPRDGSRVLEEETSLRLPQQKKQTRVDRSPALEAFSLSPFASTFGGRAPAGVQNKGVEQEAWGGRARFKGEVELRGLSHDAAELCARKEPALLHRSAKPLAP